MFKSMDNNKNKKLDAVELETGLRDFGINLNEEQVAVLVKHFDKDGSGQISFNEFLSAIRVSLKFKFNQEFIG
jgi:Ca2+-binding EF-hand superfamily protein